MAIEFAKMFVQSSGADASKSTVLSTLQWSLAMFTLGLVFLGSSGAAHWLLVFFAAGSGLSLFGIGVAYSYFARANPELLRSEKYSIRKMEIERGYVGDSAMGLFGDPGRAPPPALPNPAPAEEVVSE